jgi:hypothetical protein
MLHVNMCKLARPETGLVMRMPCRISATGQVEANPAGSSPLFPVTPKIFVHDRLTR